MKSKTSNNNNSKSPQKINQNKEKADSSETYLINKMSKNNKSNLPQKGNKGNSPSPPAITSNKKPMSVNKTPIKNNNKTDTVTNVLTIKNNKDKDKDKDINSKSSIIEAVFEEKENNNNKKQSNKHIDDSINYQSNQENQENNNLNNKNTIEENPQVLLTTCQIKPSLDPDPSTLPKIEPQLYNNYTTEQLKNVIKQRSESIKKTTKNGEILKKDLTSLISKLNLAFEQTKSKLNIEEINKEMQSIVNIRKHNLSFAIKKNQNLKNRFNKINSSLDIINDKTNIPEESMLRMKSIEKLVEENKILSNKISEGKINLYVINKKIEENKNTNKKFDEITGDIHCFVNRKFGFQNKLENNKKNLESAIKQLDKLEEIYNNFIKMNKNKDNKDNNSVNDIQKITNNINHINEWLNLFKKELKNKTIEDILNNVTNNKSELYLRLEKEKNKKKDIKILSNNKSEIISNNDLTNKYSSISNVNRPNKYHLPLIKISSMNNVFNPISGDYNKKTKLDIFNKFMYFRLQEKLNEKSLLKNKEKKENKYKNKTSITQIDLNIDLNKENDIINDDYEIANDDDFKELLKKKDEYTYVNNHYIKLIKDNHKNTEDKINDIKENMDLITKKNQNIINLNVYLQNEVKNLKSLLEITKEQNKIKKEMKVNEDKFIKNYLQKSYSDPSFLTSDANINNSSKVELNEVCNYKKGDIGKKNVMNNINCNDNINDNINDNSGIIIKKVDNDDDKVR